MVNVIKNFSENNEINSEVVLSEMDDLVISVKSNVAELAKSFSSSWGGWGWRCGSCWGCRCWIEEF